MRSWTRSVPFFAALFETNLNLNQSRKPWCQAFLKTKSQRERERERERVSEGTPLFHFDDWVLSLWLIIFDRQQSTRWELCWQRLLIVLIWRASICLKTFFPSQIFQFIRSMIIGKATLVTSERIRCCCCCCCYRAIRSAIDETELMNN
jgi:hypothetical protein